MPELTLDQLDTLNTKLAQIAALADLLMTAQAGDLREGTVVEVARMISEALERVKAIVDPEF